jgi:hypothetical protein
VRSTQTVLLSTAGSAGRCWMRHSPFHLAESGRKLVTVSTRRSAATLVLLALVCIGCGGSPGPARAGGTAFSSGDGIKRSVSERLLARVRVGGDTIWQMGQLVASGDLSRIACPVWLSLEPERAFHMAINT